MDFQGDSLLFWLMPVDEKCDNQEALWILTRQKPSCFGLFLTQRPLSEWLALLPAGLDHHPNQEESQDQMLDIATNAWCYKNCKAKVKTYDIGSSKDKGQNCALASSRLVKPLEPACNKIFKKSIWFLVLTPAKSRPLRIQFSKNWFI